MMAQIDRCPSVGALHSLILVIILGRKREEVDTSHGDGGSTRCLMVGCCVIAGWLGGRRKEAGEGNWRGIRDTAIPSAYS